MVEAAQRHQLDQLREPHLGFCEATFHWANGAELDRILENERGFVQIAG